MKADIIIAGVGGQGILSIAAAIGLAAVNHGMNLKQAEVHGMSQRGGAVQSHLRISDIEVASDLIPEGEADLIISVEPMESLRYLSFLHPDGWLITNSVPFVNILGYPDIDNLLQEIKTVKNHILIDADNIAKDLGSARSSNMVILGASSKFINIPESAFLNAVDELFSRKGKEIAEINTKAFKAGASYAGLYNSKN